MQVKIQKWGNSQGIRLAKALLEEVGLHEGDKVAIDIIEGKLVVSAVQKRRGKHTLEELVARIPDSYQPEEVEWNEPFGKEVW